jgi:hypothetical protein
MELNYINKKGCNVVVFATDHSLIRFKERWNLVNGDSRLTTPLAVREQISRTFATATRLEAKGKHYEKRLRRHGKDTLYFQSGCKNFVFVIQANRLLTVELGDQDKRHLNRKRWLVANA